MDWDDTKELAEFRATIRAFFAEKLPERYKRQAQGEYMRQSVPGPGGTTLWFDEAGWFEVMRRRPRECRADRHWAMVSEFSGAPWLYEGQGATVEPIDARLASLGVPVLLYNGEHDLQDFVDAADLLEALLPDVRRATIPEAGGFPAWEFPERVNRLVSDFLSPAPGSSKET